MVRIAAWLPGQGQEEVNFRRNNIKVEEVGEAQDSWTEDAGIEGELVSKYESELLKFN